jgi:hypothetical protein
MRTARAVRRFCPEPKTQVPGTGGFVSAIQCATLAFLNDSPVDPFGSSGQTVGTWCEHLCAYVQNTFIMFIMFTARPAKAHIPSCLCELRKAQRVNVSSVRRPAMNILGQAVR